MCLLTGVLRRSQLFEIQNLNQPGWGSHRCSTPKWVLAFKHGTASPQEELPGLVVCTPESIHAIRLQECNRVAEGMASSISWPSSGILTAGLAWSLDSDLFAQKSMTNRIGLAYLPATWRTAWRGRALFMAKMLKRSSWRMMRRRPVRGAGAARGCWF